VCGFAAERAAGERHGGAGRCDRGCRRGGWPGLHRLGAGVSRNPRGGLGEGQHHWDGRQEQLDATASYGRAAAPASALRATVLHTHAGGGGLSGTAFILELKVVGKCLACQGRGVVARAGATATCAPVRRRPGSVAGAVTADAWCERDGEEGRWMHRPISLHKPRGARGASASVPGPRHGFLAGARGVVQPGAESARRLNTISRSPV
jgi:hypothetical protein